MRRLISLLSIFLLSWMLFSCDDMEMKDKTYNFFGDSIVNHWPVAEMFPSQIVYNHGVSGAGIDYVKSNENAFSGEDVVVMIGTNDYSVFYTDGLDEYVEEYLKYISKLTDKSIYLFSVLPRDYSTDPHDINEKIVLFNEKVAVALRDCPRITYIDVFDDFMYEGHINYQFYSDGLHLTIYGYEVLASNLLNVINQ